MANGKAPTAPPISEKLVLNVEGLNDARRRTGTGASLGKEAVMAASRRVGEVTAGVERVRRSTFSASC
jgi:hypothetical protein